MPALTGIRFPLAVWVVVHHLTGPGRMLDPLTAALPVMRNLVESAWIALGVFFAISGFVLTLRYRTTRWNSAAIAQYSAARFARLYPLYMLSLLIVAPIVVTAISRGQTGSPSHSAGLVLNYVFLLQGWARLPVDWNTPAWSLSCEVFFYACFPAIALTLRKMTWIRAGTLLLAALAFPVAVRAMHAPTAIKPLIYFGDFLIGIAAACAYELLSRRGSRALPAGFSLYGPAAAVVLALLFFGKTRLPFVLFDSILRAATGALVLGLACGCKALSSAPITWGGRASYAIYILHIPVLWWYKRSTFYAALPAVEAGLLYLAIVVAVSFAACRWFEQPAEKFIRGAGHS